jgi:uncharacterized protein YndB with AHSA1/START domain
MTNTPHDDPPGTRSIRLEIEVPGTPEQVWEAIATGPGITAWFVPATVAGREGGAVTLHFGPGMDTTGRVTAWDPPRRFGYEGSEWGDRRLAYEYLVEARDGGTCVVRLVNSGFGTGADWDGEFDGMEAGWRLFLHNLRLYLTHFPGQRCSSILVNAIAPGPRAQAWAALTAALGLAPATEGERVAATAPDAPPLAGVVERVADGMLTLVVDAPASGIAFIAAEGGGEQISLSLYAYLFGEDAAVIAARDDKEWRSWMEHHFPPLDDGGTAADGGPEPGHEDAPAG